MASDSCRGVRDYFIHLVEDRVCRVSGEVFSATRAFHVKPSRVMSFVAIVVDWTRVCEVGSRRSRSGVFVSRGESRKKHGSSFSRVTLRHRPDGVSERWKAGLRAAGPLSPNNLVSDTVGSASASQPNCDRIVREQGFGATTFIVLRLLLYSICACTCRSTAVPSS